MQTRRFERAVRLVFVQQMCVITTKIIRSIIDVEMTRDDDNDNLWIVRARGENNTVWSDKNDRSSLVTSSLRGQTTQYLLTPDLNIR